MSGFALFLAVILACMVEAVEATTIVLAAGVARNWRSALFGVLGGLAVLAVIIGVAGPAISLLPLGALRLVVGGLLLVFGLQWLRKAILRSSGRKALHDEDAIFQKQLIAARAAGSRSPGVVTDWYAFTLSFKGVLLEGLEVAFIVLTFGTIQHQVALASLAAAVAVIVIAVAGFAVRRPLSRVPENTMKFIVGVMLTSFGIFWGAEGARAQWPGGDLALAALIPFVVIICLILVAVLRTQTSAHPSSTPAMVVAHAVTVEVSHAESAPELDRPAHAVDLPDESAKSGDTTTVVAPRRSFGNRVGAFGLFWYDFIVGDDWHVTAGIVIAFALTFWLSSVGAISWWLAPAAVLVLLPYSLARLVRR